MNFNHLFKLLDANRLIFKDFRNIEIFQMRLVNKSWREELEKVKKKKKKYFLFFHFLLFLIIQSNSRTKSGRVDL